MISIKQAFTKSMVHELRFTIDRPFLQKL